VATEIQMTAETQMATLPQTTILKPQRSTMEPQRPKWPQTIPAIAPVAVVAAVAAVVAVAAVANPFPNFPRKLRVSPRKFKHRF
jgi:anti-sigma factor RsiW